MSDDLLHDWEAWYAAALAPLQPAARLQLTRTLARELRKRTAQRITAQKNPDGSAWEPRKKRLRSKAGRVRSRKMYTKLRLARHLRTRATPDEASIYYAGRDARIARVAQYGLTARVTPGGPRVRYPRRELLGFSAADRAFVRDFLMQHLSPG